MKCQDLMNRDVRWISASATARDAARLMRDQSLGFLLVAGPSPDELVGIVTERDLAIRVCAEDRVPGDTPVLAIATTDVVCCSKTEDLKVAEKRMTASQKSRLVVLDGEGHPVGILSLTEILHRDLMWRAINIARRVHTLEAEIPHPPLESITLTPSTPEDEAKAMRHETIHVGAWRGSMKEFPG
jgi:CBS domain-containing protein